MGALTSRLNSSKAALDSSSVIADFFAMNTCLPIGSDFALRPSVKNRLGWPVAVQALLPVLLPKSSSYTPLTQPLPWLGYRIYSQRTPLSHH